MNRSKVRRLQFRDKRPVWLTAWLTDMAQTDKLSLSLTNHLQKPFQLDSLSGKFSYHKIFQTR